MRIKDLANAYLVLALVLGSLVPIMLKVASQNINIYEYLVLTYAVAVPASFAFVLFRRKTDRLASTMLNYKEFALIAFLGLLNYGMLEYGLTYAEQFVSASLATVVYRTFPIFMLIFLPIMLRERISKYQLAALILGLVGLSIAVTGGSLTAFSNVNLPIIGLIVLIALASAFVSVAIKKYSFDMDIAMFLFNLATFAFFIALFIAVKAPIQPVNTSALAAILYVGIVYNVFVGLMYYGALRMIKTTFVTNIYFLSPFLTFVFSWLILGEQVYLYYIAIALFVTAGILIQKLDRRGGTYQSRSDASRKHTFHDVTSAFIHTKVPAIYDEIRSGGRVLAVKMEKDYYKYISRKLGRNDNAILYTNTNKRMTSSAEDEFIRDIMGIKEDEIALMSAGDPEASEKALTDALSRRVG